MPELVSEIIRPKAGSFDTAAMARGEPGLPTAFTWRGVTEAIVECLEAWKESSREGARAQGELYLRRHCWRLRMESGAIWNVYCQRQSPKSGSPKARWVLYTIEAPGEGREGEGIKGSRDQGTEGKTS